MRPGPGRDRQQGAAALAVAMLLLLGMTMVAFYANRSLLFEQRTSANQLRATSAFEIAEAGLEWAIERVNDQQRIGTDCAALAGASTFRDKYLRADLAVTVGFSTVANASTQPGCRLLANGTLACRCPDDGNPPGHLAENSPSFSLRFVPLLGQELVEVISRGCTGQGTQCVPESTQGASDAMAEVRVLLKLLPALRTPPQAPVVAGFTIALSDNGQIENRDDGTNGITLNAGDDIAVGSGISIVSLFGVPPAASQVSFDRSLADLNANDTFYRAYLGRDLADYRTDSATTEVACSGPSDCGAKVALAVQQGRKQLYVNGEVVFDGLSAPLGSENDPVLLVSPNNISFESNQPAFGVFIAQNHGWDGGANNQLDGAMLASNAVAMGDGSGVTYSTNVIGRLRLSTGRLVRVPGSWRDFAPSP